VLNGVQGKTLVGDSGAKPLEAEHFWLYLTVNFACNNFTH